ncbi:ParB N-terminal domain-containing protein [Spirillospora sp. NBC_01491]|uniref:ParB N-terminal domain-containing protein n=1 Tax=Spirillospora sp. NBC_01491 TaxID=2976007 RepID=UPI002E2F83B9|nr:ParB N-terminal domain-containing protein [Spirillospora sp. NBC_01491]
MPIDSLATSASPRLDGEDAQHVRALAESDAALPPIVVHIPSRRVIDGMHRLRAAILRGAEDIEARLFHGTETDGFLLSVTANIQHGHPLSQEDRMTAAERIFDLHPEWSDRMVAIVVGLSGKKVAALRRRVAAHVPQPAVRIGRDGRSRPVDRAAGRERAATLLASDPHASLRQIARAAGISPATAADVRARIRRGEDPIPARCAAKAKSPVPGARLEAGGPAPKPPSTDALSELTATFERLRRDPSLRFTDAGRTLLRMFDACQDVVRHEETIKKGLPPHRLTLTAELSRAYAEILQSFAAELRELQSSQMAKSESVG